MYSPADIVVVSLLCAFCVVGCIGNALTVYVFSMHMRKDRTTSPTFILALAAADFLTCLVTIPFTISAILLKNVLHYDAICKLYHLFLTSTIPFSAIVMAAIAAERYFAICKPLKTILTPTRSFLVISSVLILALSSGIVACLCYGVYEINKIVIAVDWKDSPDPNTISLPCRSHSDLNNVMNRLSDLGYKKNDLLYFTGEDAYVNGSVSCDITRHTGVCSEYNMFLSDGVRFVVQKISAGFYLISFLFSVVMYTIIFRFVSRRRAIRLKQKSKCSLLLAPPSMSVEISTASTTLDPNKIEHSGRKLSAVENGHNIRSPSHYKDPLKQLKDKNRKANIRTALILFVVNVIFVVSFLPAWLMSMTIIQFNVVLFYMYFLYNVCNPFIYAFMNEKFRKVLTSVFRRRFCNKGTRV